MRRGSRGFKASRRGPRPPDVGPRLQGQKALPCLYIGRLPRRFTSDDLRGMLHDLGAVNSVTVLRRKRATGMKTLAMVAMATPNGTARVLADLAKRLDLLEKVDPIIVLGCSPAGEALEARFARWLVDPGVCIT